MKYLAILLCIFVSIFGALLVCNARRAKNFLIGSYLLSIFLSFSIFLCGDTNYAILVFFVFWVTDLAVYQIYLMFDETYDEPEIQETPYRILVLSMLLAFFSGLVWFYTKYMDPDLFQELHFKPNHLMTQGFWRKEWLIFGALGIFYFYAATVGMMLVKSGARDDES